MAENIIIEVVTPERAVVSDEAQIVVAPGSEGEFGVLAGHTPFLSSLSTGSLRYTDKNGKEKYVFINSGFAEALPDKVTVLAESAERKEDIDINRAEAAKGRALKRLESKKEDVDIVRATASLARAIQRLKIASSQT